MTQRGYGKPAIMEMGFPTKEYEFPETEGEFFGTLVIKKWNNKGGLICYFDTDDGRKLKLCVWFTKSGKSKWLTAELLSAPINRDAEGDNERS